MFLFQTILNIKCISQILFIEFTIGFVLGMEIYRLLFYYIMSSPNFPIVLCSDIADPTRTHFKTAPLTAGLINNISGI